MYIYIDESGSINNKNAQHSPYFVIAMLRVLDKDGLRKAYKRFVSSNIEKLQKLDVDKVTSSGRVVRQGGKMFLDGKFRELKGSQFDKAMKQKFIEFFSKKPSFELYFIRINNSRLTDQFCSNTARVFNYTLRLALGYFIRNKMLPDEECNLQLDERNERTETKYFLQNYLNTELTMNGSCSGPFSVQYFDSVDNHFIQIADVFANWYYSHLQTGAYEQELKALQEAGFIKCIFEFPPQE